MLSTTVGLVVSQSEMIGILLLVLRFGAHREGLVHLTVGLALVGLTAVVAIGLTVAVYEYSGELESRDATSDDTEDRGS